MRPGAAAGSARPATPGVAPWPGHRSSAREGTPPLGGGWRMRVGEGGGGRTRALRRRSGFGEEGRPRPRPCSPRRRPPVPYCSARRSELRARRPCLSAAAMSTAARRTPRAASFTGEAPPLEGRGGGRRARLMAGGAVAGSGLAAAGPEGRSGGEGGGRRGPALRSPAGRQPAGDGGLVAAAARRVLPPGSLLCDFQFCDFPKRPVGLAAGWMGRPATGLAQLASRLAS